MNPKKTKGDPPIGARFLFLLIPLFAALLLGTFAFAYPAQLRAALDQLHEAAPLANPTLTVSAKAGESLQLPQTVLQSLNAVGTAVTAVRYDTETADGIRIRLLSYDSGSPDGAFVLTDGRMPQNSAECVVVPLNQNTAADKSAQHAALGIEIGTAIRPCGANGDALISGQSGMPCMLTVVGIGENVLSALAPISTGDTRLLVYTTTADDWNNPDAGMQLYLTDCRADDPLTAVQSVCDATADERRAYRMALAEEQLQQCTAAAEEANNAVISHQITVQEIENRLDTANLRVAEAETNMMNAVAVLQAEQQEFVSDMEYNEYYALRQVDLIPRRDRAEEGYAKQEAVIAEMNTALHTAYDDRDATLAELHHANDILSSLQEEADRAHAELEKQQARLAQSSQAQPWMISVREQHSGYVALDAHAAAVQQRALLFAGIALLLFLVSTVAVYAVSHTVGYPVPRFILSSLTAALPGVFLGSCVLTVLWFSNTYPALTDAVTLSHLTSDTLILGAAAVLLTVLFCAALSALGCRVQRIRQSQ